MRRFIELLMFVCVCWLSTHSLADDIQASSTVSPIYKLLLTLPPASFRDKATIIEEIETAAGKGSLAPLEAMLNSELYYDDETETHLYRLTTDADNKLLILKFDPLDLSLTQTADVDENSLSKVKINNKLRRVLRVSIARVTLLHGSEDERLAAITSMMGNVDADGAKLIELARGKELSTKIIETMDAAMAIYLLESGDTTEKMQSIELLSTRLEPTVKTALLEAKENSSNDAAVKLAAEKSLKAIDSKVGFYGFIETLFFGLSLGSVFLLAAIGLAITFGVMGVINMAHGEMIMLGAYTTYVVQLLMPNHLEYSIIVAIPAAFFVSGLVGVAIEQGIIRFLHGRPLETLLATFGLSLILQQLVRTIFTPLNRQVSSPEWLSGALELNPVLSLTYNRLYILAFSLLVFGILMYVFKKTNLGLNVRAVSQNRAMAKAMGVKTRWVDAMTFGLGSGVAGVAGVALSQLTNVGPNLGQSYIIDSFMVVVFGGVGNLLGTLVGAFSLGVANKFLEPVTGAVLANIFVLIFIILFIQKRPKGLFPQKGRAAE